MPPGLGYPASSVAVRPFSHSFVFPFRDASAGYGSLRPLGCSYVAVFYSWDRHDGLPESGMTSGFLQGNIYRHMYMVGSG